MNTFLTTLKTEQLGRRDYLLLDELVFNDEKVGPVSVPSGFRTDFASLKVLHNVLLFVLFALVSGYGNYGATVHDWLYASGVYSRRVADDVFYRALRAEGVARWRAWLMWAGVRVGGAKKYTKAPASPGPSVSGV